MSPISTVRGCVKEDCSGCRVCAARTRPLRRLHHRRDDRHHDRCRGPRRDRRSHRPGWRQRERGPGRQVWWTFFRPSYWQAYAASKITHPYELAVGDAAQNDCCRGPGPGRYPKRLFDRGGVRLQLVAKGHDGGVDVSAALRGVVREPPRARGRRGCVAFLDGHIEIGRCETDHLLDVLANGVVCGRRIRDRDGRQRGVAGP